MGDIINMARVRKPLVEAEPAHPADNLSFLKCRKPKGTGIDYWNVDSVGSYSADCAKGVELGREFVAYIGRHPTNGNAVLLGWIVSDMVKRNAASGRLSGIELGFLRHIGRCAMETAVAMYQREEP